jgi:hypothetical protein
MIELKNDEEMRKAIEKAKANAKCLLVKRTDIPRQYLVFNKKSNKSYVIFFFVKNNGKKFASCTCKAGEFGVVCKHIAAAAGLNTCLAEQGLLNLQNQSVNNPIMVNNQAGLKNQVVNVI